MKKTTLLFLYKPKERQILFALKKRGFGVGKWTGPGGKLNIEETIVEAVVRETKEEIMVDVDPQDLRQAATLNFRFQDNPDWNQETHVFFCEKWKGEPKETEEMAPKWYSTENLPYENMWIDDIHWLPQVLEGKKVNASFMFSKEGKEILEKKVEII